MTEAAEGEAQFWRLAEPLLEAAGVTRSTMMGLPCLRVDEAFFASWDRSNGALLVKLPEEEVDRLVASATARPFAPAGRRFRQWASVPPGQDEQWAALLDQALRYVSQLPAEPTKRKRRQ
ncbi:MAG: DNA replication terminus site-binding protein [Acidimicrobiia bacterium]|nr:DNA replication terminus site-binding protein [Acidimicrobiia bacterium]